MEDVIKMYMMYYKFTMMSILQLKVHFLAYAMTLMLTIISCNSACDVHNKNSPPSHTVYIAL